jgi:hypothetical protein
MRLGRRLMTDFSVKLSYEMKLHACSQKQTYIYIFLYKQYYRIGAMPANPFVALICLTQVTVLKDPLS